MALNKILLKERLNTLYNEQATRQKDPEKARADFVDGLADAIDEYLKGAELSGQVSTTGTATSQTGTIITGKLL